MKGWHGLTPSFFPSNSESIKERSKYFQVSSACIFYKGNVAWFFFFFLFWRHLFGSLSSKCKISHKMHTDLRLRCSKKSVPAKNPPSIQLLHKVSLATFIFWKCPHMSYIHLQPQLPRKQCWNSSEKILSKDAFEDENEKVVLMLQLRVSSISTHDCRSFKRHGDKWGDTICTHTLGGAVWPGVGSAQKMSGDTTWAHLTCDGRALSHSANFLFFRGGTVAHGDCIYLTLAHTMN